MESHVQAQRLPPKALALRFHRCYCRYIFFIASLMMVFVRPAFGNTPGGALFFDGIDDYATAFPNYKLLADWTVEAWVQPYEPVVEQCILSVQTVTGRNLLKVKSSASAAWQVLFGYDEQPIPYQGWLGDGKDAGDYLTAPHHVAVTHKFLTVFQSQLELYLNGTRRATWFVDTSTLHLSKEAPLPPILGACTYRGHGSREGDGVGIFRQHFYRGYMDEVRLWNMVRTAASVLETMLFTGPSANWPSVSATAFIALRTQYCFDVLKPRLYDSSGYNADGWLGTVGFEGDAPAYQLSPFDAIPQGRLAMGSIFLSFREGKTVTYDFLNYVFKTGMPYNGLRIVTGPTASAADGGPRVYAQGYSTELASDSMVAGTSLTIAANTSGEYFHFSVQPCRGVLGAVKQVPLMVACLAQPIFDVSIQVIPSTPPVVGPVHAIQLLSEGAFIRLPALKRPSVTVEFWLRLVAPLQPGATILSTAEKSGAGGIGRELVRLYLDTSTGGAMLDVCSTAATQTQTFWIPGISTTEAQQIALSFDYNAAGNTYVMRLHRNCVLLLDEMILSPCAKLDSTNVWPITLGQRYVADESGATGAVQPWSQNFAAMFASEIRVYRYQRATQYICWYLNKRLRAEAGLDAYMPVTTDDAIDASVGRPEVTLITGRIDASSTLANLAPRLEEGARVECAIDYPGCPNFENALGFAIRPSTFNIPPEEVTLATTSTAYVSVPLVGHDPDNYKDYILRPELMDDITFEILEVPDPKCGYLYAAGQNLRILEASERAKFGLPPTTQVPAEDLPLSFHPFEGTTVTEVQEMGGACSVELRYRAIDSQGLASKYEALIHIHVFRPGPELLRVNASDPGGNGSGLELSGGMLRFDFSAPTTQPNLPVDKLFEVFNGSWGTAGTALYGSWGTAVPMRSTWIENGAALLVQIAAGGASKGLNLVPGLTTFRVRKSAGVQTKGDKSSRPCETLSPPLIGSHQDSTCVPGTVLNFGSGACDECSPGDHWKAATSPANGISWIGATCEPCPSGEYETRVAAVSCLPCPAGTYLPANSANRTVCLLAAKGMFVSRERSGAPEYCLHGSLTEQEGQKTCETCPDRADCSNRTRADALHGYTRVSDGNFYKCRIPGTCLGKNQCSEGHLDSDLGCYICSAGLVRVAGAIRDGRSCTACASDASNLRMTLVLLVGSAMFAMYLHSLNITGARRPACLHPFMLKIGLGHLFMMSTLSWLDDWQLEHGFGTHAKSVANILHIVMAWDGMMPINFVPLECLLQGLMPDSDMKSRLWVNFGFWAALPFFFLIFCVLVSAVVLLLLRPLSCFCRIDTSDGDESGSMSSIVPYARPSVAGAAVLPSQPKNDWRMVWSAEHKAYYFHDTLSGESSWDPPKKDFVGPQTQDLAHRMMQDTTMNALDARVLGIWREKMFCEPICARLRIFWEDTSGIMILALTMTYPGILKQFMTFLRCDTLISSSSSRLLMEPELACADLTDIMIAAWVALFIWGLGLPVLCVAMVHPYRRQLGRFASKVRIGVLAAEYEIQYYWWDALILLRRFGVVAAALLAPGAPIALRLVLLVAVGSSATVVQVLAEPFDNRCGLLLDVLEAQALSLYCVAATTMLVTASGLVEPTLAILLVVAVVALHMMFLGRLAILFVSQMQRSIADSVVETHLTGKAKKLPGCCNFMRRFNERIFMFEMGIRQHRALVRFDELKNMIVIDEGRGGKVVSDAEQNFVANGIADCVAHAVSDCHLERLSVHLLEYLARQAFLNEAERLRITDTVRQQLGVKLGFDIAPDEDEDVGVNQPSGEQNLLKSSSKDKRLKGRLGTQLFKKQVFDLGMAASDFQGSLIMISLYTKERWEYAFGEFMIHKGLQVDDTGLNARDRLLKRATEMRGQQRLKSKEADGLTITITDDARPMTSSSSFSANRAAALMDRSGRPQMRVEDVEEEPALGVESPINVEIPQPQRKAPLKASEGSLAQFLAGDTGADPRAKKVMVRETPDLPQPERPCYCSRGHRLMLVGPSESGWVCDAGESLGACRSGIVDFYQSAGLNRFECRICNYDVCEQCHAFLLGQQAVEEDSWTPSQLPGYLPEDEEALHGIDQDQYRPNLELIQEQAMSTTMVSNSSNKPTSMLRSKSSVAPKPPSSRGAGQAEIPVKRLRGNTMNLGASNNVSGDTTVMAFSESVQQGVPSDSV